MRLSVVFLFGLALALSAQLVAGREIAPAGALAISLPAYTLRSYRAEGNALSLVLSR
ncbi:MAG: hypothetical protein HN849_28835 [Victivallales bacterium]|jgi:hypothetical protein|nr:hypothetical protein [Victivallales bacterium]MBT7164714.1 hypothetical protein [Victivallales bacterium]MBT7303571.1 hypothetical protein [Victivallales bacterium]